MTPNSTTFLKRLKGIALSANERLQMRERLALYADMHAASSAPIPSVGFFAFLGSRRFSTYAVALVVVLVAGSGVTLGAEGSVPGDTLYTIKTDVNEPIMTAFAQSPTSQARVASELAARRVDEAVTLASRGELTTDRQDYLAKQFDQQVKTATKKTDELAKIDSSAADEVKAGLVANLAGEAQALGAVTARPTDPGKDLLRAVIATNDLLSDGETEHQISVAVATTAEPAAEATETPAEAAAPLHAASAARVTMTLKATATTTASTTPDTHPLLTGRFSKRIHITMPALLRNGFASTTLNATSLLLPKVDVAIPTVQTPTKPTAVTQTGDAEGMDLKVGD